ncbi:MAG: hypothetical protein HY290_04495 [Planctomycetia bacterium]|nr:hypothetical protein [Planctomycetia bacterium]
MTVAGDLNRIAEGKIVMAIRRLAGVSPFHGDIAERFVLRHFPEVKTIGVTIEGDSIPLLFCEEFVESLTLSELQAVLQHEVNHVVLGHILADPAEFTDLWAHTVAVDVSANEFVSDSLPSRAITLEAFPKLPPLESAEKRYSRLRKVKRRRPIAMSPLGVSPTSGNIPNLARLPASPPHSKTNTAALATIDNHAVWVSARKDTPRSAKVIQDVVRDAVITVGADQIPEWLHEALRAVGVGNQPGADKEQLRGNRVGKQNWIQTLRRYIGRSLLTRPDFLRPPRRFSQLAGIVPGRRYRVSRPRIMAVIDTSASLDAKMLEVICAELARMAKRFRVTVVECDSKIHRVYAYKPILAVHGRGGTDLCPPFELEFLREHRPDVLLYFTDGFGPAPESAPAIPAIWCLTPDGVRPAAWGRTLQMQSADGK